MNNPTRYKNIDDYIQAAPQSVQNTLQILRHVISEKAPEAVETISYQIPTFKLSGESLVHFAAFKNHISFFPTSSPVKVFKKELTEYKTSNGTIQFPLDKPLPLPLIRKIVQFRVDEVKNKVL